MKVLNYQNKCIIFVMFDHTEAQRHEVWRMTYRKVFTMRFVFGRLKLRKSNLRQRAKQR